MVEEWRTTHVHPEYEVSNFGRVRSLDRRVWGGPVVGYYIRPGRLMKPSIGSHGYPAVKINPAGTVCLHTLVTRAFLGPCPEGHEVRHIDGERWNSSLLNLEYGTKSQNSQDAFRHGSFGAEMQRAKALKGIATKDKRYPNWRQKAFTPEQFL